MHGGPGNRLTTGSPIPSGQGVEPQPTTWEQAEQLAQPILTKKPFGQDARASMAYTATQADADIVGRLYAKFITSAEVYHAHRAGVKEDDLAKYTGRARGPRLQLVPAQQAFQMDLPMWQAAEDTMSSGGRKPHTSWRQCSSVWAEARACSSGRWL